MHLMIDIDDREYAEIKEDIKFFRDKNMVVPHLYKVIESGLPLPKDHGKIVDLGKIDKDRIEQDNPVITISINGSDIKAISLDYLYNLPDLINKEEE